MELYIDIADLDVIKTIAEYYPVDGFTTNPKILTKAKKPVEKMMAEYRRYVQESGSKIFFQVTGNTAEKMLEQALALKNYFGENFIVKIPAVKEGYKAVRMCKKEGITVTVTVIHSTMQALIAAKAGADYVAPYVTHIDNIGADGVNCVAEMVEVFKNSDYSCKVLGASFRTVDQLKQLALVGCQAVTISPDLFDALIKHPSTDDSMCGFENAWKETFNGKEISDLIPEEED